MTNTTRPQLTCAFPPELLKKFALVLTYEDVKRPKPAPDALLAVMKKLHITEEEMCYVGDTPTDIYFAHNANVLAIGITTGDYSMQQLLDEGADVVIESLADLGDVLKELE